LVEWIGVAALCLLLVGSSAAWSLVVLHLRRMVAADGGLTVALKRGEARWANGVGRYASDQLVWYRTLSLSPTADLRMPRAELKVLSRRCWDPRQDVALFSDLSIVECRFRDEVICLGFPGNGVTGFLSWLEASAPSF